MIAFGSGADFEAWLAEHHETATEVWIKLAHIHP
jgi:hypothetical protein